MGPFVQGDGFYVVGTPPAQLTGRATGVASRPELLAEAAGWHRDAYSHHGMWRNVPGWADDLADGGQPFTPPLAAHMLCYLQDMDGPGGPLLAVPGSHRSAFGDKPAGAEEEAAVVVVDAKAGDAVFFHCDMLHSGSANRADNAWRYMVTSFVVRAGLPHRDDFTASPLVRALVAEAEACGDRRVLRFFAADAADGGPLRREQEQWRAAVDEERRLLRPSRGPPYPVFERFDHVLFSHQMGSMKPSRECFDDAVRTIGCEPGEIVFLDDSQTNVDAARDRGLRAFRVTSPHEARGIIAEFEAGGQ
jgi:hypothetical protein